MVIVQDLEMVKLHLWMLHLVISSIFQMFTLECNPDMEAIRNLRQNGLKRWKT